MKTPRETLLARHRAAESKLDAIRETVVASVRERRVHSPAVTRRRHHFRDLLVSLRWHLAGMSAAWLVIVLLNLNISHPASPATMMPAAKIPPPQIILASLRENRRELLEMIQPAESRAAPPVKLFPRSERPRETLTA